ncbi:hypothetical protein GGQ99_005203 [Aminobacter niigataensis]|uniref:CopG family transcriptional regulator n=2 Tax=Aminobacter niigataensis TaxID=83265 RepID=A0ABR6L9C0_9HYPH|nr:DUF411 domain-containing protein [Aminobacter niigataensis]MBB4653412.1 hypothetical protein [Aminobacter niigataensis]
MTTRLNQLANSSDYTERKTPMLRIFALAAFLATSLTAVHAGEARKAVLYKNPQCGCCEGYADYLRKNGFEVEVKPTNDLAEISRKAGVSEDFQGCHSTFVDGYVIDGHVPLKAVEKLLTERPDIAGISLPGMPMGSPGMVGDKTEPFTVYAITKDGKQPTVYTTE